MPGGEATLAWILFWVFTVITTIATFLIVHHHRSRRLAVGLALLVLALFVALYLGLRFLFTDLGL